ncbi:MAG: endonuclease V [bacterium]
MHTWDLNENEARMLQESLAEDCILEGKPDVELIGALDVSIYPDSKIGIASAVNYSITRRDIVEEVVLITKLNFPYISGLLAFREAPPMIEAAGCLKQEPDCYLIDGHGYAHPRRIGLASHIGLFLDRPTIGCAKNILVGEYEEPGEEVGSYSQIWDGEPVGYAVRSLESADPIFLSPGHKIDPKHIPTIVDSILSKKSKLPEPLRLAHNVAKKEREKIKKITQPFLEEEAGVFLVGGTLRDLLLGKKPLDYDLMVSDFPEATREKLENEFQGHFFTLDEERQMYRLPGKEVQIDLTVVGPDEVVEDLKRRDFTINSVALDMARETWVDPVNGKDDARQRILKPTGEENLKEDPLRILRAYRLAQHHRLSFAPDLLETIQDNVKLLEEISKERIVEELFKISIRQDAGKWFKNMNRDGVLEAVSFFRTEGADDASRLEKWRPVLKNHSLFSNTSYHGNYSLLDGFKATRIIGQDNLEEWPFHRHIKQVTRASYEKLPENPSPEELLLSDKRLLGRLLGLGLWENWDRDQMLEGILSLDSYLQIREKKEKEFARELEGEPDIGERKKEKLFEFLPEIWDEYLGGL